MEVALSKDGHMSSRTLPLAHPKVVSNTLSIQSRQTGDSLVPTECSRSDSV